MGILAEPLALLRGLELPPHFAVCELGDQYVTCTAKPHRLAREFYRTLGCRRYESIDGNGRGTLTFDLNSTWKGKVGEFDLVTDFGTGEHIFNQAQVWRTLHLLAKPTGYLVFDRPTVGYPGHGFYLCDEGLFRDVAAANHYRIRHLSRRPTTRGELVCGVFQKTGDRPFVNPQQRRYQGALKI